MAKRVIFATEPGGRDQSRFRLATSRREEITVQQEIDDLGKKSISEIILRKESRKAAKEENPHETLRKLAPEFKPKKVLEKRKLLPVFHESSAHNAEELQQEASDNGQLATRDHLDQSIINAGTKSKKLNIKNDAVHTTEDLKKPKVTSLGVLPPHSEPVVKVILTGHGTHTRGYDVEKETNIPKQDITMDIAVPDVDFDKENKKLGKPAILGTVGTLQSVKFTERPPPKAKPMTHLKAPRARSAKSAASNVSSFMSVDIHLPKEGEESHDGQVIGRSRAGTSILPGSELQRTSSSRGTIKSVKDLIDDAKKLATPEVTSEGKSKQKLNKEDKQMKHQIKQVQKPTSTVDKRKNAKKEEPTTERSVDEIIASLKEHAKSGMVSEADLRIQEIMNRVVSHSGLGDIDNALSMSPAHNDVELKRDSENTNDTEMASHSPKPTDQDTDGEAAEDEEEEESKGDHGTQPLPMEVTEEDQPQDNLPSADSQEETTKISIVSEDEESLYANEETRDTVPDLAQAWRDLTLPSEVAYEDIINVTAKQVNIYPKHVQEQHETFPAKSSLSLLSSWTPAKADIERMESDSRFINQGRQKGIHHFCTITDDIQLPDHYRGIWRRYHVPSKYDFIYKDNKGAESSGNTSVLGRDNNSDVKSRTVTPHSERSELEKHQSYIAQRIIEEASKLAEDKDGTNFEAWHNRAQQVFDQCELTVDGKQMSLQTDESFLYWSPAPPKWDIPPKVVQNVLFPLYHGAIMNKTTDDDNSDLDSDDNGSSDELQPTEENTIDQMARDRTLSRQYSSAQDLTALTKTMMELAEGSPSDKLRPVYVQIKLLEETFTDDLENTQSVEYETKRKKMQETLTSILTNALGDQYRGLEQITFSRGSVIVHFGVLVPMTASSDIAAQIQEALELAVKRNVFGDMVIDTDSISIADEITSTAELVKQQLSQKPSFVSYASSLKTFVRREITDVPNVFEQTTGNQRQRHHSAPGCLDSDEDMLLIYQDYNTAMEEIMKQRKQLKELKNMAKRTVVINEDTDVLMTQEDTECKQAPDVTDTQEQQTVTDAVSKQTFPFSASRQKEPEPTPAELALEAGRAYVLLPNKSKKKKKKISVADLARIDAIQAFLSQKRSPPSRSSSFTEKKKPVERLLRVPQKIRERKNSLPAKCEFEVYKKKKRYNSADYPDDREWVRSIWDKWFDEVYPPTPPDSESEEEIQEQDEQLNLLTAHEKPMKRKTSVASTVYSENIELEPAVDSVDEPDSIELLKEEVEKLNKEIKSAAVPSAFQLCRRGAILRKLGQIKQALNDLSLAIQIEPMMLDAYWHRHLVYILLNKKHAALDDLNILLKYNKSHVGAYKSRAVLYREQKDTTMAIINYTQAIKCHPDDDEAYFQRAEMYEERGDTLLAMEDYSTAFKINPKNTEALFRHGIHYYKNGNWENAIQDFSELLKHNPHNADARMLRGRTYAQLKQWNEAVADLSAAIHLKPSNAKAFYYRACLLRKLHPKKALQDYSVSLLLDDSDENILCYLHRAILYNEIGRPEDAIPDFEAVLKLDRDFACAHVNLGLIYMQKMHNHQRAIKKFTAGIRADPTYVKAYICRAEAYTQVHDIKNALLDITRAIHLKPDLHHLYMYRGQLVLKLGNLELATFCVKHAAELKAGLGHSPTQQAIVQSFLKNYDKATEALEAATRVKPVPQLFMLLGKTRMKAQQWKEAVDAFERAIELVQLEQKAKTQKKKPWQEKHAWPTESAEMFYLVGMCHLEMRDYMNAHDAFNNAIQVDKRLAEAYYWRGMTRIKLKQSKGIQDFNRALALDPDLFQAYLSRAAYYGLKGRYSKGILNCNEAIRLQPTSVRAYLYRGALKYHIKAYELAIHDLSQAIAIDNTCALAYFNRAVCYHDSGNYTKALQDYGIVLLLGDYLSLKVLINRGLLYFTIKDYKNTLHDFLLAAAVNPEVKNIQHTLGLCYHKLNCLKEAVNCFTRALKLDMFFLDALIGRGNVFMDFGHEIGHMYARRDYERAIHLNPQCLPARVNLAYNLQVSGKYQQAWRQFTTAIALDDKFRPALEGRAVINLQMSDTFAAYQDISRSVNIEPTAELLTNRGVIHQFCGDKVNAMRDYQKAIKLDPTYALAYFNAANVYLHTRQFKQALDYFNLAIKHNGKDESAYLNRAITKVMLKDGQGALSDFDAAIRLSPFSAHVYFNRGNLYASLCKYEQAEADYSKALELHPDDPLVYKKRADVRSKLDRREDAIADYKRAIQIQSQYAM